MTTHSSSISAQSDEVTAPSLQFPVRIAAIDVGSNSIRLIVADVHEDSSYRVLDDERELARLGSELPITGRLPEAATEVAMGALKRMRDLTDAFKVNQLRCIATSAVRDATNGKAFVDRVRSEIGLELEVISAEREARLAFRSISRQHNLQHHLVAAMDIGGGSAQLILAAGSVVENVYPFKLGAVRLASEFPFDKRPHIQQYDKLRSHVREQLLSKLTEPPFHPEVLIGTGGTFTTLGAIHNASVSGGTSSAGVQGVELSRAQLHHIVDRLLMLPLEKRRGVSGLPADRADIIVHGLCVVDETMEVLGINRVRVHEGGVRDGLINEMIRDLLGSRGQHADPVRDRLRSVRRFAERCGYDKEHAEHTMLLACRIFDQLCEQLALFHDAHEQAEARMMLEAGSILHDVGYLVNYSAHHKHSYHLISNADLEGLSKRQVEIIANIARYHRKSEPKKTHAPFQALDDDAKHLVRLLAGVLRIAAGLNRTRTSVVRDVQVDATKQRRLIVMALVTDGHAEAEVWGAKRKENLLAEMLGYSIEFVLPERDDVLSK
ncbi:MAG: Ppx/GppA family phosphatase [Phycisphaeraceae bacterium]|nr:Ppx/GppA family phosphatase [Phycisphaerales bacterium]MCB9860767.1 Ppx/GppA family phosphatase [Phycisphaeraceae bacterium]